MMVKIKSIIQTARQSIRETFKLLQQFKWYVAFDAAVFALLLWDQLNPPEKDSPLWKSESTLGLWNYQNQELYLQSGKYILTIFVLFFLIGTSNMRNHPLIAKLIFLFPLYIGWLGIL